MPQLNGVRGSDVDCPLVDLAYLHATDNVRSDRKDCLVRGMVRCGLSKKVFQDWNLGQAGYPAQRSGLRIVKNSARQAGSAISQPVSAEVPFLLPHEGRGD